MLFPDDPLVANRIYNDGFAGGSLFKTLDGTPEQAKAVIRYIEDVRKKYERELKRTIILPGGEVKRKPTRSDNR